MVHLAFNAELMMSLSTGPTPLQARPYLNSSADLVYPQSIGTGFFRPLHLIFTSNSFEFVVSSTSSLTTFTPAEERIIARAVSSACLTSASSLSNPQTSSPTGVSRPRHPQLSQHLLDLEARLEVNRVDGRPSSLGARV